MFPLHRAPFCGRNHQIDFKAIALRYPRSRKVATKYTGAKAVVHQLCAFWTPSIYQPEDSAAYVGLTSAVIDSTGSRNSSGRQRTPVVRGLLELILVWLWAAVLRVYLRNAFELPMVKQLFVNASRTATVSTRTLT